MIRDLGDLGFGDFGLAMIWDRESDNPTPACRAVALAFYVSGDDIGLAMRRAMHDTVRGRIVENAERHDRAGRYRASADDARDLRTIGSR